MQRHGLRRHSGAFEEVGVILKQDLAELVEHVDLLQIVALAHVEVVEVVRRRDLHRTRTLLRVGIVIPHDGDQAANQRQANLPADQVLQLLVLGVNGNARVTQHGFRARGGNHNELIRALDRVAQVPEIALHFLLHHFEVGDGGQELRVPVHKALVLVDQAFLVELHEHLEHGLRQALVHGEALARPVTRGAEAAELARNRTARLFLPRPDALQEGLAAHGAAIGLVFLLKQAFHHHLGGDAGMVGAGLPEHVLAAHPLETDQDVLDRVVERVPHMERAGDVGRRNDDGERFRIRLTAGLEKAARLPFGIKPGFHFGGRKGLLEHGKFRKTMWCSGCALNTSGPAHASRVGPHGP